jgi:RNA polymerase sigma-B factor
VHRYLPLARRVASRYHHGAEPFEDLVQVASVGLLMAIDRYDPGKGAAFSSYAVPTMAGELRRHFRDRGWTVRPPRALQEHALLVERAAEELHHELRRAPTVDDLARRTGLDVEAVLDAREALNARAAMSLSSTGSGRDEEPTLEARLGGEDEAYRIVEQRMTIASLTCRLTAREREILRLRFDEDLTQAEIGRAIGRSQMQVSRLLRSSLEKLRTAPQNTSTPVE